MMRKAQVPMREVMVEMMERFRPRTMPEPVSMAARVK